MSPDFQDGPGVWPVSLSSDCAGQIHCVFGFVFDFHKFSYFFGYVRAGVAYAGTRYRKLTAPRCPESFSATRHHEELDVAQDRSVEVFDGGGNRALADAVTIASVQIA